MTTSTLIRTQLRYYPSLLKMLTVLAGSLAFVFGGVWLLRNDAQQAPLNIIAAFLAIALGGLGSAVYFIRVVLVVFARKPWLLINSRGIFTPNFRRFGRSVVWEDVAEVAIYEQRVPRASQSFSFRKYPYTSAYWFVAKTKAAEMNPSLMCKAARFARTWTPSLNGAVICLPLTYLYVKPSPAKGMAILAHLRETFAPEISRYDIIVQDTVLRM